ncbi:MAG: tetratricopeptide repeat protein [Gallionella sp.]|nr:tetratricopeptide repeat protein [Gallionella sp.]
MFNRFKNFISPPEQTTPGNGSNRQRNMPPTQPDPAAESVAHKERGDAHLLRGNMEEAKACYQQAIALNPYYAKAHSNLGFVFKEQGCFGDAERCLKAALSIDPKIADAHYMLGTIFQTHGKLEDTLHHFRKALELDPEHKFAYRDLYYVLFQHGQIEQAKEVIARGIAHFPNIADYHFYLGNLYAHTREFDKAAACYRTALAIQPDYAAAHFNLGIAPQEQGNHDEAIASYQKAIELNPNFADAHFNLGMVFFKVQRLPEAEASFRRVIQINPDHAEAHYNLGNILRELGRLDEAEESYRQAMRIKPDHADAQLNLGNTLKAMGRLLEAESSYRQLLQLIPESAETHCNLGNLLDDMGRLEEAEASYRRALQIRPDLSEVHSNLGNTLKNMRRISEAEVSFRQALQFRPKNVDALTNLALLLQETMRFAESEATFRLALQINPNRANAHCGLGTTLRCLGRLMEAEASYRQATRVEPDYSIAHSSLLFLYSYHALIDPREYLAHARKWELACVPEQDRQAERGRVFQHAPLAGRRLKIGYVSGDFRQHAVSFFIEQLFSNHDRARVEVFAYSNSDMQDAVTERLQASAEHWVNIVGLSDAGVRNRIEADGIDVLIDLSGHTQGNRIGVFARRAAPVQAYYLGYFASTGLTEMDYWIGDDIVTPPETDSHFSEQVWRLPRVSWSYNAKDAPPPDWRPDPGNVVRIGSFNQLGKLTPATLSLWANILHALPEGRLLLKTKELADIGNRQRILDAMTSHGVSQDRIELKDGSITPNWQEHMAYYNRLDIVLDSVGAMGGVTSTCDALWMGAPVITLIGDRVTSRATAAIVNAIGHPEWIAHSEDEYLDKVVALARNVEQRKALRSSQRDQMARSRLCDAKDLAINLENAYVEMFRRWLNEKKLADG